MEVLLTLFALIVGLGLVVWLYITVQGDAEFEFLVDQRTNFSLTALTDDTATFTCKVPFINKGPQDGTIMDAFTRHLLPREQFDAVAVYSRLELEAAPRSDGYWEALIVPRKTGQTAIVTVKFTATAGDIRSALAGMVDMPVDIVYQVVARGRWYLTKNRLLVTAAEVAREMERAGGAGLTEKMEA